MNEFRYIPEMKFETEIENGYAVRVKVYSNLLSALNPILLGSFWVDLYPYDDYTTAVADALDITEEEAEEISGYEERDVEEYWLEQVEDRISEMTTQEVIEAITQNYYDIWNARVFYK